MFIKDLIILFCARSIPIEKVGNLRIIAFSKRWAKSVHFPSVAKVRDEMTKLYNFEYDKFKTSISNVKIAIIAVESSKI